MCINKKYISAFKEVTIYNTSISWYFDILDVKIEKQEHHWKKNGERKKEWKEKRERKITLKDRW